MGSIYLTNGNNVSTLLEKYKAVTESICLWYYLTIRKGNMLHVFPYGVRPDRNKELAPPG